MKNYDVTRRKLKEAGWRRTDRTERGVHKERWATPRHWASTLSLLRAPSDVVSYLQACKIAGIAPWPEPELQDPKPPYRRDKALQAKHLDTKKIIEFVADRLIREDCWTTFYELEPAFPDIPRKLFLAKMRGLIGKGLLDGCGCGCRGDFEMTSAGWRFIRRERYRDSVTPNRVGTKVNGRQVRDLWWEEDRTMCVQFDDTGELVRYPRTSLQAIGPSRIEGDRMIVSFKVQQEPLIKMIPITFQITELEKK